MAEWKKQQQIAETMDTPYRTHTITWEKDKTYFYNYIFLLVLLAILCNLYLFSMKISEFGLRDHILIILIRFNSIHRCQNFIFFVYNDNSSSLKMRKNGILRPITAQWRIASDGKVKTTIRRRKSEEQPHYALLLINGLLIDYNFAPPIWIEFHIVSFTFNENTHHVICMNFFSFQILFIMMIIIVWVLSLFTANM